MRKGSPQFSEDYERQQHFARRYAVTPAQQAAERRCMSEGSDAAWSGWPTMPTNPYTPGTLEWEAWGYGARASFAARGDRDYCPALHAPPNDWLSGPSERSS